MNTFFRDLRYSARMLVKSPAFTFVAILSIALGIGANTVVFSVVNAVLLKAMPFKDPASLVLLWGDSRGSENLKGRNQVSATDVADFRKQATVFEDVATYAGWFPLLSGDGNQIVAERVAAIQVGDGFFKVMKGDPILGRVFTPEEQQDGKDRVIVLGHALWQNRFGSDSAIVGKTIQLNSRPYTVVGVMGADFHPLPSTLVSPEGQFYRPVAEAYDEAERDARHLRAIARLKPGVTTAQAQAEVSVIAQRLEQEHPVTNKGQGANVVSIRDDTIGGVQRTLVMVFGAVFFVLLVACANVANLLLARSSARHKEITIRAAIGAGRWQLIRQLLTESILLAICGGALGLLFATWGTRVIEQFGAKINPMFRDISIDGRTLAFTIGLSLLTAVVFGLAPALQMSKPNLTESLKEGGRGSGTGASRNRLRSALVVAEIAMTLILLVGAGLLLRTVTRITQVDKGFNSENVLAMNIGLPGSKYPKPDNYISFYQQTTERIASLPGVKAAGITSVLPLSANFDGRGLAVEDFPKPRGEEFSVDLYVATPGYLKAMEIGLAQGRAISDADTKDAPFVALINRTMADEYWPNQNPLGKRVRFAGGSDNSQPWRTIVGVVNDVSQYALDQKPPKQLYLPHAQFPTSTNTIVVKTTGDPMSVVGAVRKEILAVDKDQAVFQITTLNELLGESILVRKFFMLLLSVFAGLALVLAAVGIYGVMSYAVTQRTQEIGIRMALGAQAGDVLKLIVKNGLTLAAIGIALGLLAALGLTRLMQQLLFGVSATDATTFAGVSAALVMVVLLACYLPARRATKVDPLVALRN
ncbi:MAG: putative transport system permease protein [Blastocatellia bacterium]|jgi:putative ABC transport system permease protein|nr:putative transport system permease protein [Blastocatellia bacterium]